MNKNVLINLDKTKTKRKPNKHGIFNHTLYISMENNMVLPCYVYRELIIRFKLTSLVLGVKQLTLRVKHLTLRVKH